MKSAFCIALIASGLMGLALKAQAQRAFTNSISLTNKTTAVISWKVQSFTPVGDLILVPQYQVVRSPDLKNWTPVGSRITGALHQTLSVMDSNPGRAFYRVQSIIDLEYAQMDNVKLTSGEMAGADFLGQVCSTRALIRRPCKTRYSPALIWKMRT